ncbi:MAG: epoxyqueuosine reductase QueH [Bacilli bacterium]|nr:epoxyqueuosine reductase QueH [Bacilli bacterium]
MNYDKEMNKIIESLDHKPKLLLHSCCAPCSTTVIERLISYFDITILYYNPNIEPISEYELRKGEQKRIVKEYGINFLDCDYDNELFNNMSKGLELVPERGIRCHKCYRLRLDYTAKKAKENNFEFFGTTLTVSPYKLSNVINEIGLELETMYDIKFLVSDFKKNEGYKRSIELSRKYNLYRQNYCGCKFSKVGDINE